MCYEKCGYEHLCTSFCVGICFHFSWGLYLGVELLVLHVRFCYSKHPHLLCQPAEEMGNNLCEHLLDASHCSRRLTTQPQLH